MKRLVYLISTFLILAGMYGGNVGAKDHNTADNSSTASGSSSNLVWCARITEYNKGSLFDSNE